MFFSIIKLSLRGRNAYNNPGEFVKDETKEMAFSFLIFPIVFAIIILAILFIFAFTHIWGGPFALAKIFFFILFIGYLILSIPIYLFYKLVSKASKRAGQETNRIFVKAEIKE